MKPDAANRVLERHKRMLRPRDQQPDGLFQAFRRAGRLVEEPIQRKPRAKRDETGRPER